MIATKNRREKKKGKKKKKKERKREREKETNDEKLKHLGLSSSTRHRYCFRLFFSFSHQRGWLKSFSAFLKGLVANWETSALLNPRQPLEKFFEVAWALEANGWSRRSAWLAGIISGRCKKGGEKRVVFGSRVSQTGIPVGT